MPADSVSRMGSSNGGGSSNNNSISDNILGTSPGACSLRSRTDSESSESRAARFVLPSVDGSPPKVMTFEEVTDAVKNIQQMELAHEIALNPEFKIEPYVPPENSLERRVRDMMHKAFWDMLRQQLSSVPPCYDHAIQLLNDIKECFPQILSPNNMRVLDRINEVLDPVLIRQQAENNTLDFRMYAQFIVNVMGKLCAPARDEAIKKLAEETDVVETFRGILETMSLMKLDMVNFYLDFSRKDILANSVEYEREKFKAYKNMGFPHTESWLMRNKVSSSGNEEVASSSNSGLPRPSSNEQSLMNAYMELVDWDLSREFPEMLSMDKERILKYGVKAKRLCASAAVISIVALLPPVRDRSQYRKELAKEVGILLQDCNSESEIASTMENIWEQIKVKIDGFVKREKSIPIKADTACAFKDQILKVANKNSPVLDLMRQRLKTYFKASLIAKNHIPPPPPGFPDYKEDLESYALALKRVIMYNNSVFGDFFNEILDGLHRRSPATTGQSDAN